MGISFAREYKKFEETWLKRRTLYIKQGMPLEQIEELYLFDKSQFARDLAFYRRTQSLHSSSDNDFSDTENPLFKKFLPKLSVTINQSEFSRYSWIDDIEDIKLHSILKKLKTDDIELLTLIAIEGYSQVDIAKKEGVSKVAICKRLKKIKKLFENG